MQLLEQIKRSVSRFFSSLKLRVVLESNVLFPPNLKDKVTTPQKSYLIYRLTWAVCYIGRSSQCLEIRINQHIPSSIRTHTSDYITTLSSYNSASAIGSHLLPNQTCASLYVYQPRCILLPQPTVLQPQPTVLQPQPMYSRTPAPKYSTAPSDCSIEFLNCLRL